MLTLLAGIILLGIVLSALGSMISAVEGANAWGKVGLVIGLALAAIVLALAVVAFVHTA